MAKQKSKKKEKDNEKEENGGSLSWIIDLAEEIPRNREINPEKAVKLINRFWTAATALTDRIYLARKKYAEVKIQRETFLNYNKSVSEEKSEAAKGREVMSTDEWEEHNRKVSEAEIKVDFLNMKRQDVILGLHMLKDIVKFAQADRQMVPVEED